MTFSTAGMTATHRTLQATRDAWNDRLAALDRAARTPGTPDRRELTAAAREVRSALDRVDDPVVRLSLPRAVADRIVRDG